MYSTQVRNAAGAVVQVQIPAGVMAGQQFMVQVMWRLKRNGKVRVGTIDLCSRQCRCLFRVVHNRNDSSTILILIGPGVHIHVWRMPADMISETQAKQWETRDTQLSIDPVYPCLFSHRER